MKLHILTFTAVLSGMVQPALADVRELTRADLRQAIADDQAIASHRLIKGVEDYTGGSVVNVRAFELDGAVTYRILVKQDDGALGAIMLEGDSGRVVMPSTEVGISVSAYARETLQQSSDTWRYAPSDLPQAYDNDNGHN